MGSSFVESRDSRRIAHDVSPFPKPGRSKDVSATRSATYRTHCLGVIQFPQIEAQLKCDNVVHLEFCGAGPWCTDLSKIDSLDARGCAPFLIYNSQCAHHAMLP
jgi:hypothetical protein